ncbi:MAG: hypothetical protein Q8M06_07115, partial [Methanobacteriaceae archaeon]|nr:hypothetical protein [Methanobacteriaceae archaeon]
MAEIGGFSARILIDLAMWSRGCRLNHKKYNNNHNIFSSIINLTIPPQKCKFIFNINIYSFLLKNILIGGGILNISKIGIIGILAIICLTVVISGCTSD